MQELKSAALEAFGSVRFVLTDMDETLTYKGRLAARTYTALEKLQAAGLKVIPVTATPAGWCDQMARMWPIDGVIAENGGLFMHRTADHNLARHFWHDSSMRDEIHDKLQEIGSAILKAIPTARLADDQPFRLTSLAFAKTASVDLDTEIAGAMRDAGLDVTLNNLWILGWIGGYDKLAMARRIMRNVYGIDIDQQNEIILYSGDSLNDAPMFGFFHNAIGVSTVRDCLHQLETPPKWITEGPGGDGFVEIAETVIRASENNEASR